MIIVNWIVLIFFEIRIELGKKKNNMCKLVLIERIFGGL